MSEEAQEQFGNLIDTYDTAMLVTRSLNGELRGRPMVIARHDKGGLMYFATRSDDEKLREMLKYPRVAVTMQSEENYLSVSGKARVDTDLNLAEELWSPAMKLWFPDGARDPALTVIRVEPEWGEYWDRTNLMRLEFLWEAGKALVRGEEMEDSSLSEHGKVSMKD